VKNSGGNIIFEGNYKRDKMNGFGILKYTDKEKYTGEF
jgi:hypothetical protein